MILVNFEKELPAFTVRAGFMVEERSTVVLWGESGSGKTTILSCIAGLASPERGEISIDGDSVYSSSRMVDLPPQRRASASSSSTTPSSPTSRPWRTWPSPCPSGAGPRPATTSSASASPASPTAAPHPLGRRAPAPGPGPGPRHQAPPPPPRRALQRPRPAHERGDVQGIPKIAGRAYNERHTGFTRPQGGRAPRGAPYRGRGRSGPRVGLPIPT